MELLVAFGVIEVAPFLTAWSTLVDFACTSAVGIGLVAVGSIVTEAGVVWAVLPADGTNSRESFFAVIEAQGAIFLLASWAIGKRLTSSAARGLLPTRMRNIAGVTIVVMEVVNWSTVVVLFCMRERLLR